MTPTRRLRIEDETLDRVVATSPQTHRVQTSPDLRLHEIAFEDVRTLVRDERDHVQEATRTIHVLFEMAADHPRRQPFAIARSAALFSPHIARPGVGPNHTSIPYMCLGTFQPRMRLADWVVAAWNVLRFANLATDDPIDAEAADWVRRADPARFPTDPRTFEGQIDSRLVAADDPDATGPGLTLLDPWMDA